MLENPSACLTSTGKCLVSLFRQTFDALTHSISCWLTGSPTTTNSLNTAPSQTASNMATDQTFSVLGLTAAQVASTADLERNPRSSYYIVNKGPTRMERGRLRINNAFSAVFGPIKKLLTRTKTDRISKSDISGPSSFVNPSAFVMLTGEKPPTSSTAANSDIPTADRENVQPNTNRESKYGVHTARPAPSPLPDQTGKASKEKEVIWVVPAVRAVHDARTPATASTATSVSSMTTYHPNRFARDGTSTGTCTPLSDDFAQNVFTRSGKTPEEFGECLDGTAKVPKNTMGKRPVSEFVPPSQANSSNTLKVPGVRRVTTMPPTIPPPSPFNPRISGFDDPHSPYLPGKYVQANSGLREVANASDDNVQQIRDAALSALEQGPSKAVDDAEVAAPPPTSDEKPQNKREKPAYRSSYCPDTNGPQIYFPLNSGINEPLKVYNGTPYASSDALATDRNSGSTFPSTPSTAPSTPALPFTPGIRHSQFYKQMEHGGTFSPVPFIRPANPSRPTTPDSASFLETVYESPPTPPPQEQSFGTPVPPRKPVPQPATKPAPDVHKSLPPSPAPNSPRRHTPRFPPRVDSLANRAADTMYLHPNAQTPSTTTTRLPQPPQSFNDNGYLIHDPRASRGWSQTPAYVPRGPMNEIEEKWREKKVKREASAKLAREEREAKERARKERKLVKEEKAVRKLCGLQ